MLDLFGKPTYTITDYKGDLIREIKELKNDLRLQFSDEKLIRLYQLIEKL